ncbi:hypothetical protein A3752_14150 [Oleiphilus sp. HI0081]|jgi:hypothetical protein|uniref:hypothetical protein n=2 Tax=Oleiphilus TaxID=141450 RepID=UPI0007C24D39|nr:MULTISPECIES: hypothetical protein [unclassified Oleiphilus]KZY88992.1 hypothetical protein A3743_09705 [Oleiphilus sp. HI0072]KZZ11681.1 hypothetical protein A3749_08330 [Oleiphilus sp. HI0078]KZZ19562.1 hypothetical protein A3752_14150 [Oleiphilus sp. HI0081]KZY36069.1 hypothetical protein A3729_04405 [Oleiphilus sp. HI0043]KZZ63215.1 hypothetical protein A3763_06955 [Oleiphilus sp. HI0128]
MKYINLLALLVLMSACSSDSNTSKNNTQNDPDAETELLASLNFPTEINEGTSGQLRATEDGITYNKEAIVPPQCYTKHEAKHNPCMACHQTHPFGSSTNYMADGVLQAEYAFSDVGVTNHWKNLFEDKTEKVGQISDQEVIDYINTDNYTPLIEQLEASSDWEGPIPKLVNLQQGADAFDDEGIAKDGSYWVAFNYKPQPSTFWPTNGSTDDVMVRLPEEFRAAAESCTNDTSAYSRDTYLANLAIMEAAIKNLDSVSLPQVDERVFCTDLNNDGHLGVIYEIDRPAFYVGQASDVAVVPMLYPEGVQFLHTVRYVGVSADGDIGVSPRMKEVRYMRKFKLFDEPDLISMYGNERQEKIDEILPKYINRGDHGLDNSFGWMILGFIENADGSMRRQSYEEHNFCMGCHTSIGSTIDQTFAFPRKVTGSEGWGYINLKGMKDAPVMGDTEGEILDYLKRVGGGDEFRENGEMLEKWFNEDGTVKEEEVVAADVYELLTPSVRRALDLNKAYMTIVADQDFIHGRDANITPVTNVYKEVDPDTAPTLPADKQRMKDIRLQW